MIMNKSRSTAFSLLNQEMKKLEKNKKTALLTPKKNAPSTSTASTSRYGKKKTSKNQKKEELYNPHVPDRSYGDLYCRICDSHMNATAMWEAHITGKRHMKNVNKGDIDIKYEDLKVNSNADSELKKVTDAVIGLSFIQEIRRKETSGPPYYNCFLCSAIMFSVPLLVEHVVSYKHRLLYMKEQCSEEFELIEATKLKKGHMEPLVEEKAIELEKKIGRGEITVKQEKPKVESYNLLSPKRDHSSSDDNEGYQKPSKRYKDEGDVWKSVDTSKMSNTKKGRNYRDRKDSYDSNDDVIHVGNSYKKCLPMRKKISESQHDSHSRSIPIRREISPEKHDSYARYMPSRRDISPEKHDSYARYMPSRRDISPEKHDSYARYMPSRRDISPDKNDAHSRHAPMRREISLGRSNSYRKDLDTDDHPRHSEYDKYSHHIDSTKREKSPAIKRYEEQHKMSSSREHQSQAGSLERENNLLPHEVSSRNNKPSETDMLETSIKTIFSLPYESFLKVVRHKLMQETKNLTVMELSLLTDILRRCENILTENLPACFQPRAQVSQESQNNVSGSDIAESTVTASKPVVPSSGVISQPTNPPNHEIQPKPNYLKQYFGITIPSQSTSSPSVGTNATLQQHSNMYVNPHHSSVTNYLSASNYYNTSPNTTNTAFPSSSYDNNQAYSSSGIPGLTLTQNEDPDPTYSNYPYQR